MQNAWPDNSRYFITAATVLHYPYFSSSDKKMLVLNRLRATEKKFGIRIEHWSIAINHLHFLVHLEHGKLYPQVKQFLLGGISHDYNQSFGKKYPAMWSGAKAIVINKEEVYWRVVGYIIGNLIKHKEHSLIKELADNPFTSYASVVKEWGEEFANNLIFSVMAIEEDSSGEVDMENLIKM